MTIVVRYLVPYLKRMISDNEYRWLTELVKDAVQYAEQTILGHDQGERKKQMVVDYIVAQLDLKGIHITQEQLEALIESAVYVMKKETIAE